LKQSPVIKEMTLFEIIDALKETKDGFLHRTILFRRC
jgi:hypothetical protein